MADSEMIFYRNDKYVEHFRKKLRDRKVTPQQGHATSFRKISICTTCMNRLRDIQRTLPHNIEANLGYPEVEFILLDYSSTDGLAEWVQKEMSQYLKTGILRYCFVPGQAHFRPGHSRNVSFRIAAGHVIFNVDADNFIHTGFVHRINECVEDHPCAILVPSEFLQPDSDRLLLKGRFGVWRNDLYTLGGFDERLDEGFGSDDVNFVFRAIMAGFEVVLFESDYMTGRIETSDEDRVKLINTNGLNFAKSKALNEAITTNTLSRGSTVVNKGLHWGKAEVIVNFTERLSV